MSGRNVFNSDAVLHSALRQVNVELENEHVNLHGKMPAQVHADHKAARREHLLDMALSPIVPRYGVAKAVVTGDIKGLVIDKAEAQGLKALNQRIGPVSLLVRAGLETIDAALKNMKEGKEIHESLVRVNAYLVAGRICSDSMPDGFIPQKVKEVPSEYKPARGSAVAPWPDGAEKAFMAIHQMPNYAEVKLAFADACREGQRAALDRGARHPEELDLLLRNDADLRRRYETDTPFRVGFDSARWALERGKADEIRSNLNLIERPALAVAG